MGDVSPRGLERSCGFMVNYRWTSLTKKFWLSLSSCWYHESKSLICSFNARFLLQVLPGQSFGEQQALQSRENRRCRWCSRKTHQWDLSCVLNNFFLKMIVPCILANEFLFFFCWNARCFSVCCWYDDIARSNVDTRLLHLADEAVSRVVLGYCEEISGSVSRCRRLRSNRARALPFDANMAVNLDNESQRASSSRISDTTHLSTTIKVSIYLQFLQTLWMSVKQRIE